MPDYGRGIAPTERQITAARILVVIIPLAFIFVQIAVLVW